MKQKKTGTAGGYVKKILDCGAVGDGRTLNTAAIQSAIDECHAAGGGQVFCGPGEFRIGSLELKSHVELHLARGCRLVGSTDIADYPDIEIPGCRRELFPEDSAKSLLYAVGAEDFAITGPGEVDGSGVSFYDTSSVLWERFYAKPPIPRPRMLTTYKCRRMRIEDAAFNQSPCWTFWLILCEDVGIHRITMEADQKMVNNDGIDLDMCRNVTVSDCRLRTGDDCIVLRSQRALFDTERPCENIVVSNCVLDSACQGIRVGCPSDGVIRNCTFSNLAISGWNGINFNNPKFYLVPPGDRGSADIRRIIFSNIAIDCNAVPIHMDVAEGVFLVHLGDVSFDNIRIRSPKPIEILGSPDTIIQNVSFSNMTVETYGDDAIVCRHCRNIRMSNVELSNLKAPAAT